MNAEALQIDHIIDDAIGENPVLEYFPGRVEEVVENALGEIKFFERLAKAHEQTIRSGKLPWSIETVKKLKVLWVLSGPGLYRQQQRRPIPR